MTNGSRHAVLPPFLVGAALGISAVVASGLLLYGGAGFVRALVVVIATLLTSLSLGVSSGAAESEADPVETLRRRWLLLLFAFALASIFSGLWEVFRGMGARALTQGAGLALLAALPHYAGGAVLGTMRGIPDSPRGLGAPAPAALLGAAAGALGLGFVLFPTLSSTASLLVGLVVLSAGALAQGWVLDETLWIRPGPTLGSPGGRLRLERWERGSPPLQRTAILRGETLLGVIGRGGEPIAPLDALVDRGVRHWAPTPARVLVLDAGAGAIAVGRLAADAGTELHLVDADPALLEGWRSLVPEGERERLHTYPHLPLPILLGRDEGLPEGLFDLVILHSAVTAAIGAPPEFPPEAGERLASLLAPEGVLVVTPLRDSEGTESLVPMARSLLTHLDTVSLYVGASESLPPGTDVPSARLEAWERHAFRDGRPVVLVAGRTSGDGWPDRVDDHLRVRIRQSVPVEGE